MTFEPDGLFGQFFLIPASASPRIPTGWRYDTLGEWSLVSHPSLPVAKLNESQPDSLRGWVIGWPIGKDGIVRTDDPVSAPRLRNFSECQDWLGGLSGRFAVAAFDSGGNGGGRFYLDSSGSLAAVFSQESRCLASTPSMLAGAQDREDVYRQTKASQPGLGANQFYPAGITGDDEVGRLLPNHYLDLLTHESHRWWPVEPLARVSEAEAPKLSQLVAQNTRHCIESLAAKYELSAGLSAGRDSRMLLACARDVLPRIEFVTFNYKDPDKFADVHIARKLAHRFKLNYRVLDLRDPSKEMKADYLFRIGYTNNSGKTCDFYDACYRMIDMKRAWLVGYGGEVGRAFYWKPSDESLSSSSLDPADLLTRMHLPVDSTRLEAMRRWQASVPPGMDAYMLLDLMYQELRLGCWASPQIYGAAPFAANIMPLGNLQNYAAMMAMPVSYRRGQVFANDVIRHCWAELLEVPFQRLTGWRHWISRAKRRIFRRR